MNLEFILACSDLGVHIEGSKKGPQIIYNNIPKELNLSSVLVNNTDNIVKELEKCNVDAIIVSDPAIIKLAKEHTNLEIHLSTQASIMNVEACKFYKELGVTRIVLARETSKEEIKNDENLLNLIKTYDNYMIYKALRKYEITFNDETLKDLYESTLDSYIGSSEGSAN